MKRLLLAVVVFCAFTVWPLHAGGRFIVRTSGGLSSMKSICLLLGCNVARGLDGSLGQVFLVTTSDARDSGRLLAALATQSTVVNVELDFLASIPSIPAAAIPTGLWLPGSVNYFASPVLYGYAAQPASQMIRLATAQRVFNVNGAGTVAVIDTGIDPDHPALKNVVLRGYDFTRDRAETTTERADLNQSTAAVVDPWSPTAVGGSTIAVIDPSTARALDHPEYAAFGHGTMVAGIVHLVAPKAWILPLKAFGASGTGYTSDIIRAIYYAVRSKAKILNMSFNLVAFSPEMKKAIDFASSQGVISVAAAGNNGQRTAVYPAALSNVIAVASTGYADQRSSFSNYGSPPVWMAAPGEAIISTYPFGTYAAASGTSFSTPFVAGTAALLVNLRFNSNQSQAAWALSHAKPINKDLGNGRLDVYQAVQALFYKP